MSRATYLLSRVLVFAVLLATAEVNAQNNPPPADKNATGDKPNAFTGLAQAPEANPFVGASSTSIPIDVPPGRKNLTLKLALSYSSSGGPSPYGYGRDLPLGRIQRATKDGVLSCSDATYRNDFVLTLPGSAAECTRDTGTNVCNPRIDEAFVRIEYVPGTNSWLARDKSGMRYVFGDVDSARAGSGTGSLFASGSGKSPCTYTYSWALTSITDPNGNTVTITYQKTSGVLYPSSIFYGGNSTMGLNALFEVKFLWLSRPSVDQMMNSSGGFPAQLTQRVSAIEVRYPAGTGNAADRVRWYSLQYEDQTSAPDRIGRQSFLSAVTLYDKNNQALARMDGFSASTIFQYHQPDPNNADPTKKQFGVAATAQTAAWPPVYAGAGRLTDVTDTDSTTRRDIFDINGDGIPDLVDTYACSDANAYWDVYLGTKDLVNGPMGFSTTRTPWAAPMEQVTCGRDQYGLCMAPCPWDNCTVLLPVCSIRYSGSGFVGGTSRKRVCGVSRCGRHGRR